MTKDDFPQFHAHVAEVMAAAANLVETVFSLGDGYGEVDIVVQRRTEDLEEALFAAQHSKPRDMSPGCKCQWEAGDSACEVHGSGEDEMMANTYEKTITFDKWGYGMAETNQFIVDGSKPGGKDFIAAIESTGISSAGQEDGSTVITIPAGQNLVCNGCGMTLVQTPANFAYGDVVKPTSPYAEPPECTSCAALLDRGQDPKKEFHTSQPSSRVNRHMIGCACEQCGGRDQT